MVALGLIMLQLSGAGLRWAEIVRVLAPARGMLEFRGVPVEQALFSSVSVGVVFFLASLVDHLLAARENSGIVNTC
jgi:hypothetical protein